MATNLTTITSSEFLAGRGRSLGMLALMRERYGADAFTPPPTMAQSLGSVNLSVQTALKFRMPGNYAASIKLLTLWASQLDILVMYKHFFPHEFASSTAPLFTLPLTSSIRSDRYSGYHGRYFDEGYGERELDFMALMENLLPIDSNILWNTPGREDIIPLEFSGICTDRDCCWFFGEERLGWQLIALLTNHENSSQARNLACDNTRDHQAYEYYLANAAHYSELGDCDGLLALYATAKIRAFTDEYSVFQGLNEELVEGFYDALIMFDHGTANPFLDNTHSDFIDVAGGGFYYWSDGIEGIQNLVELYQESQKTEQNIKGFLSWLERSPENLYQMVLLWNWAATDEPTDLKPFPGARQNRDAGRNLGVSMWSGSQVGEEG